MSIRTPPKQPRTPPAPRIITPPTPALEGLTEEDCITQFVTAAGNLTTNQIVWIVAWEASHPLLIPYLTPDGLDSLLGWFAMRRQLGLPVGP